MRVSVFDLDHTLARGNVSFAFGRFLYSKGELRLFQSLYLASVYALHKLGICSLSCLHKSAFRCVFYKKCTQKIGKLADEFLFLHKETLFRPSLLGQLFVAMKEGQVVWILSSSPDFLVERIATSLGVAHYAGSCYQKDEKGKFSCVHSIMDGKTKEAVLDQFLQKTDWSLVAVYTDSILDLPLLEKAGHPVAVFPDKALRKVAKSKSWNVWEG